MKPRGASSLCSGVLDGTVRPVRPAGEVDGSPPDSRSVLGHLELAASGGQALLVLGRESPSPVIVQWHRHGEGRNPAQGHAAAERLTSRQRSA